MPGFDGTGPRGLGPMTGGGRGFCASPAGVRGVGYRRWRGHPRYRFFPGTPYWTAPVTQVSAEDELAVLKNEATALKSELDRVESMIKQLEKEE